MVANFSEIPVVSPASPTYNEAMSLIQASDLKASLTGISEKLVFLRSSL